jgi:hypothetical protein
MVHRPARTLWAGLILVFASLAVGLAPARAQTVGRGGAFDPFTVSGVAVDKTAQSAAAARADAIAEGQRLALQRLVKRLAAKQAADRISVTAARAAELVRDFDIAEEKSSGVRYIAKLNVRFKPDAVRAMLRAEGAAFAETASRPLVVVPVYEGGGAPVLWDDANPWREAWNAKLPRDGLVPMALPAGDPSDMSTIKAEQARDGDSVKLRALAAKYNAGGTLVAVAKVDPSGEVQVTGTRLGATGAPQTVVERFKPSPGESRAACGGFRRHPDRGAVEAGQYVARRRQRAGAGGRCAVRLLARMGRDPQPAGPRGPNPAQRSARRVEAGCARGSVLCRR